MRRRALVTAAAAVVAGCAGVSPEVETDDEPTTTTPESSGDVEESGGGSAPDAAEVETVIHERINDERTDRSAGKVYDDRFLADPARDHSEDMDERDFYAHQNPDYEQPWDRVECDAAEVLHRGEIGRMRHPDGEETYDTTDAEELAAFIVDGWLRSEGHREVILDPVFERGGVGVHINDGEFWVTAMFC